MTTGGFDFPSTTELLRRARAIRTNRLAREGAEQIALNIPSPTQPLQPPLPPQEEGPGIVSRTLSFLGNAPLLAGGGSISEIFEGLESFNRNVTQPIASVGLAIPSPLTAPLSLATRQLGGEDEAARQKQTIQSIADLVRGRSNPLQAHQQLGDIQRSRPLGSQIASEAVFDPTNLIPGSLIARTGARAGQIAKSTARARDIPFTVSAVPDSIPNPSRVLPAVEPALRTNLSTGEQVARTVIDVPGVVQLPDSATILNRVNDPALAQRINSSPGTRAVFNIFNPNAVADMTQPSDRFIAAKAVYDEQVRDAASAITSRVLRAGDPVELFDMADDFSVRNVERKGVGLLARAGPETGSGEVGRGIFLNEIAQNPDDFLISIEQRNWLDNFSAQVDNMLLYMQQEGIIPDAELFAQNVKGRYFPNIWKMFNDLELSRRGVRSASGPQFYEQSRMYDYATDALNAGFRPGDPKEAVQTLFNGMYRQVEEKKLAELLSPWHSDIERRIQQGAKLTTEIGDMNTIPREQKEAILKALNPQNRLWLDGLSNVSAAIRTLRAGFDLGVGMIHGLPTLLTRPSVWAATTKHSFEAMGDLVVQARFVDDHWDTIQKLIGRNQLHGGASDFIEGLNSQGLLHRGARALETRVNRPVGKVVERGLEAVERQFESWLIASKVYLWEAMEPMALRAVNPEQALDDLAAHISKMTGTISMANLGVRPSIRKAMSSFFMFAPRYRMATYGLMLDVTRGGLRGELARTQLGKMAAAGMASYIYIATRLKQDLNLDPTKGKFMTIQVGDANIGIGSAYLSTMRFMVQFAAQMVEDPQTAMNPFQGDNRVNRFLRGQIAPLAGVGWDVMSGRNYIGEPLPENLMSWEGARTVATDYVAPFWVGALTDYPRAGWAGGLGEFGGLRSFPISFHEQAMDLADVEAQKMFGNNYRDLPNRLAQIQVTEANPEIQKLFDESSRLWANRSPGLDQRVFEYREQQKSFQAQYDEKVDNIERLFVEGKIGGKKFRDELSAHGRTLGDNYDRLNTEFPLVIEAFEDERENPLAALEDVAYNEYIGDVVTPSYEIPDTLEFDFQAREQAEVEFKKRWGNRIWAYVQERRSHNVSPLLRELYDGRDALSSFWEVDQSILEKTGNGHLTSVYRTYRKARQVDKDSMVKEQPILRQIERAGAKARQLRQEQHAPTDAFLYRWEYRDVLRHQENKLKGEDEIVRTPVKVR